jgi:large subunit ribosomal protein L32
MVPALRTSRSRKRKRRSHLAIKPVHTVTCPISGMPKLPHAACPTSGYVRAGLTIRTKKKD